MSDDPPSDSKSHPDIWDEQPLAGEKLWPGWPTTKVNAAMTEETVEPPSISADTVRPGDVIRWCDRPVTIVAVDPIPSPYGRRPAVYLTAEADDMIPRRLHYYADESVELASDPE
jgi:hypothetical protein